MDIFLSIVLQIVLVFLNAVFACAEIAILSVSDVKLVKMVQEGDKRAKRVAKFKDKPSKFLSTIQVAITLSGFLGSAFAASNFADPIVKFLNEVGVAFTGLETIIVIAITLLLSFITIVFGELVPKRVAMKNAEKMGLSMSGLLMFISKLFAPIVWLLTVSTNGVLRMMRIDPHDEEESVSEEEIVMMAEVSSNAGVIDDTEKEMIKKVFEFDDMTAGEFATHRTDMVILWLEDDNEKWKEIIHETRHSIYPVCGESADDLVGMLNAKDFFRLYGASREEIMEHCVKPAYYVPETVKADVLFRQMKKTRNRFAVVLDEYGGVFGIVTMNDIIEQIVGGFDEESIQEEEEEIVQLEENKWRIKGSAYLSVVCEKLDVVFEAEDLVAEEYDTFGGLVFGHYGMIPSDGSTFSIDIGSTVHVEVRSIVDHRIEEAIVTVTR
ncbi:MAG: HlyC/CorC family transporter, partial [Clostridia bacterium]|nr:HlyC/CorC family transporter [Clostridia bacterium]